MESKGQKKGVLIIKEWQGFKREKGAHMEQKISGKEKNKVWEE